MSGERTPLMVHTPRSNAYICGEWWTSSIKALPYEIHKELTDKGYTVIFRNDYSANGLVIFWR